MSDRATFHLGHGQDEDLEVLVLRLRTERRIRVTKSDVVRTLLAMAVDQYGTDPDGCELVKRLKGS